MKIYAPAQASSANGFTIVELMISLAILAVVVALALPNLSQIFSRNALTGATNELIAAINQARSEAVSRSSPTVICPSVDGAGCDNGEWEEGWIVFSDDNGTGGFDVGEAIIAVGSGAGAGNDTIDIDGLNGGIRFGPTGILAVGNAGNIDISHTDLAQGNRLTINAVGQIDLTEYNT